MRDYFSSFILLPLFIVTSYFYGNGFFGFFEMFGFDQYLNLHDHYVYLESMDLVRGGESNYEFANDKGIASIYLVLTGLFPYLVTEDMESIAFIFNTLILLFSYLIYSKISDQLGLGFYGRLSFFVNLSLIYFSQLINKDMLTIFYFLIAVRLGMSRSYWLLLMLVPLFVYVRIQLAIFTVILIYISLGRRLWWKVLLAYLFTSLLAGYLSVYHSIIGDESLGSGFNLFVMEFNRSYLVGYVLFNPVRLFQYVVDAYLSFVIYTEDGAIDVAKVLRIPILVMFVYFYRDFFSLIVNIKKYLNTELRPLILVVIAYSLTWLMSPIINARYVMLITPVLLLAILAFRQKTINEK